MGAPSWVKFRELVHSKEPWLVIVTVRFIQSCPNWHKERKRNAIPYVALLSSRMNVGAMKNTMLKSGAVAVQTMDPLDTAELVRTCQSVVGSAQDEAAAHSIIGQSPAMREVFEFIGHAATVTSSVLLTGETGTGKDLVAQAIHQRSGRRGRYMGINCAAMPEALLESELFGHVRGSFTGANTNRKGLIESCEGGTFFLDEVDSTPLPVQAKLLRFLQDRKVRRVGDSSECHADVRIIAASLRPIEPILEVQRANPGIKLFREDLYYRLAVLKCRVPPLRERDSDVELLAHHFARLKAKQFKCAVPPIDLAVLKAHPWHGNVRELENHIEAMVVMTRKAA